MADYPRLTVVNIGTLSVNKFWHESERVREPSATCVLIETDGRRMIVDPSPHPEELGRLLFDRCGLRPGDVDDVFLTHRHGDHRFGLKLFEGKPWLMADAELEVWRTFAAQDFELTQIAHADSEAVSRLRAIDVAVNLSPRALHERLPI